MGDTQNTWGGRRRGAGRPQTNSKLYSLKLPEDFARIIDEQENKTEFTLYIQYSRNRTFEDR